MRCTHSEKLIPLFAGGDLPARKADALRRHLESCANCRRLADEFEESRDWLRGFAAPQFDDTMLDDLRDSVLRGIGRVENRSEWLQWIVPGLNLQFATSMVVLLLIAFFATFVYRGRQPRMVPGKENLVKKNPGSDQKDSTNGEQRNGEMHKVNPSPVPTQHLPRKNMRRIIENLSIRPVQPPDEVIVHAPPPSAPMRVEPVVELPPSGAGVMTDVAFDRAMTRIEFQTADPNIRIIWLTPKDSNSTSTKPNTNTR